MDSPATNAQIAFTKTKMEYASPSALLAKLTTTQPGIVQVATRDSCCYRWFVSRIQNQRIPIALISIMECAKNAQKGSIFSTEIVRWLILCAKHSTLTFKNAQIATQDTGWMAQRDAKLHLQQPPWLVAQKSKITSVSNVPEITGRTATVSAFYQTLFVRLLTRQMETVWHVSQATNLRMQLASSKSVLLTPTVKSGKETSVNNAQKVSTLTKIIFASKLIPSAKLST